MATDDAMRAAILAAHARWSGAPAERFPVNSDWEPPAVALGTAKITPDQQLTGRVPRVPTVPSEKQYRSHRTGSTETADATGVRGGASAEAWAAWVERAAIREYSGRMSRAEAEVRTALELGPCPPLPDGFRL